MWRRSSQLFSRRTRELETVLEKTHSPYNSFRADAVNALVQFAPDERAETRLRELLDDEFIDHYAAEVLLLYFGRAGLGHVLESIVFHHDSPHTSLFVRLLIRLDEDGSMLRQARGFERAEIKSLVDGIERTAARVADPGLPMFDRAMLMSYSSLVSERIAAASVLARYPDALHRLDEMLRDRNVAVWIAATKTLLRHFGADGLRAVLDQLVRMADDQQSQWIFDVVLDVDMERAESTLLDDARALADSLASAPLTELVDELVAARRTHLPPWFTGDRSVPIQNDEVAVIESILTKGQVAERHILANQLRGAQVRRTTQWILDIEVPSAAVPARSISTGLIPVRAFVTTDGEYRGEILIWTAGGFITGLEYAYVTDNAPPELPALDDIEVTLE